ncbi:Scr1 family TA system antitoxin-like transcriptional regulator [Actinokineospora sp. HUAS TT18]|uniref:Scr1 family TA system antitoxin-like transcriptional regulator n=1 Tax=Actinokineospora sp. HUAS TT18 TaxID=3447451 RepID=UPI003F51FD19
MTDPRNRTLRGVLIGAVMTGSAEKAGLTLREIAEATGFNITRLCRMFNGHRPVSSTDIAVLSMAFGWPVELRNYLVQLAAETHLSHWLFGHEDAHASEVGTVLESFAQAVTVYAPLTVPRVLRATAYDNHVRSTLANGAYRPIPELLSEPTYEFFLDAHVLTRPGVPESARQQQLTHLLCRAGEDNVVVRIVPANAHHGGLEAFRLLQSKRFDSVVHLEQLTTSLLLQHPDDVTVYRTFAHKLQTVALDPIASRHFIAGLLGRSS